jgi:peroxiredoxin Q/BCP
MTRIMRLLSGAIIGCGVIGALAAIPRATSGADELKVGDEAPDFTLPGSDGKTHTLSALKGKYVVLAWFPKAFTAG